MEWMTLDKEVFIDEVIYKTQDWKSLPDNNTTFGSVAKVHWFRLKLKNSSPNTDWLFSFDNNTLQNIDVWLVSSSGRTQQWKLGGNFSTEVGRTFWLPTLNRRLVILENQTVELYFKIDQKAILDVASKISPLKEALNDNIKDLALDAFYFGLLSILALYHLLLFIGSRQSFYLFYSVFTLSIILLLAFVQGYLYFVFDNYFFLTFPIGQSSLAILSIASLWFLVSFFSLHVKLKWIKPVNIAFSGVALLLVLSRLIIRPDIFINLSLIFMFCCSIWVLYLIVTLAFKMKLKLAMYFFIGWSGWILWAIYIILGALQVYSFSLAENWFGFKLTILFQFLFFAWLISLRIQDLRRQAEFAEARDVAKSQLLARVSHELRTPLNGVIGITKMLENERISKEGKKLLKVLNSSSESLISIVNDLLEVSRLNQNKIELNYENIEARPFFESIWGLFEFQIKSKEIKPELILDESLPRYIKVDSERLKQILINLIGNSYKFTDKGSIKFQVAFNDMKLECQISDTGRGIKSEDINKVFEPFEQIINESEEVKSGTGLGLYITKELIRRMSGEISVESKLREGTTFKISIPCEEVESFENIISPNPVMGRKLSILVAEDNPVNFLVIKNLLEKLGHDLVHSKNGEEAFNWYKSHYSECDIILMDCEMPIMSGYQAAEEIRRYELENCMTRIPIVAVTAHVYDEHFEKIKLAGMDRQVNKPLKEAEVKQVLVELTS
ncbi:hybrid sensor histidine kinase/response regulator [Pleionea sediminis]|uniref:hybrid sensor histidine kinase/response regulator n=1 Tax=Pleionea sediminis TaxID=2569479 RepID=UPI001186C7D3|nr:hybrid sensor histidine kinase/response regulator [Pleionea sediminis]